MSPLSDRECVQFLQWALPRLDLHWPGFRKVRGIVCKRVERRRRALSLTSLTAYRERLICDADEWQTLRALCSIPISRFCRDQEVFTQLEQIVLPALAASALARRARALECWSVGCASGEEPYSISILWRLRLAAQYPDLGLQMLATDTDQVLLKRATLGCYSRSSLREMPEAWRELAFEEQNGSYCLREPFRVGVLCMPGRPGRCTPAAL
jgi:chemotaxis protein methyltransferase CheR